MRLPGSSSALGRASSCDSEEADRVRRRRPARSQATPAKAAATSSGLHKAADRAMGDVPAEAGERIAPKPPYRAPDRGSSASRSASPSSVKPSAVTAMQMPGRKASCGAMASSFWA